MAIFYVYEHWHPDTNTCFWVGKGKGKRAWSFERKSNRHYTAIVGKLTAAGLEVAVKIVVDGLAEDEAFALEKTRISFWRQLGVKLANLTDGGEGAAGLVRTEENKRKLSVAKKGKKLSAEHKRKIGLTSLGRRHTEATKAIIGAAGTGRRHTEESKRKIGAPKIGKPRSSTTKTKISEAKSGKKWIVL